MTDQNQIPTNKSWSLAAPSLATPAPGKLNFFASSRCFHTMNL